ncbi:MAG: flagellar basal body-associated FliL family protein [Cycloclasticus sp.]|uniref:flagellar basal body-associated FliL family protein n=1 Tax=Cycloclasticus TaxID=34067 RepID=UPI00091C70A7|nr:MULTISPECIES: flagellar basal body-associated FliL family protein [Cycloclasticus]MBV1898902.1 flagellar basal body-associated FliL family protein [Cycloclasticus sp.]SHI47321.1 flagellar FliL protein [Cycloclasticus pugetii]|tara:strand:- start:363 stop:902 length:540 start_codon:yes stop_codon:yes gene_type:complete
MADEEQEQETAVENAAGSKKKLIMIAGGVVLAIILLGAGLYFTGFFEAEKGPVVGESTEAIEEKADEQNADEAEAVAVYQALTPPFMVNFSDGNIKVLKLAISIMVDDEGVIDAVKKHDPVIRNNILMMLSAQDPEVLKTSKGKEQLQSDVKEEINKILVKRSVSSNVKEVFFTDLVMQ